MTSVVLKSQNVLRGDILRRKHAVIGQLLTAKAYYHDLTAKVRMTDDIGDRADRDIC